MLGYPLLPSHPNLTCDCYLQLSCGVGIVLYLIGSPEITWVHVSLSRREDVEA